MKNELINGEIRCILNGCKIDFPLYCRDCDSIFCVNCYNSHLQDFYPSLIVLKKSDGHLEGFDGR